MVAYFFYRGHIFVVLTGSHVLDIGFPSNTSAVWVTSIFVKSIINVNSL